MYHSFLSDLTGRVWPILCQAVYFLLELQHLRCVEYNNTISVAKNKIASHGASRPLSGTEVNHLHEWKQCTEKVRESLKLTCGEKWIQNNMFKWIRPSDVSLRNGSDPVKAWTAGLNANKSSMCFSA